MSNVFEVLQERGYIKQMTHEKEIKELLKNEKIVFYIGFDPTADSLHVGHFIAMMFMSHMQKHGHKPIALIGGGTGHIGDPSGRTDMRKMMTDEIIEHNVSSIKKQMEKFIDFSDDKALLVNNAEWLRSLNYIDFIRDIGSQFSVNKMLSAECFKSRMESGGLSFLEFNYMLMQGYDFLVLNRKYNCVMELGGDDQWSNMIAGVDLLRKKDKKSGYAMTCTLLTNSEGKKMGKTANGALWLDPKKVSPYEFYQYWRNLPDGDVAKPLALLTYLPMDEVRRLSSLEGAQINEAKQVLAFEVTKIVHGEIEAEKAKQASEALFSQNSMDLSNVPTIEISQKELNKNIVDFLLELDLLKSKSEGRRLIQQNGLSLNNEKISDYTLLITKDIFVDNSLMIKQGKKKYTRIILK